MTRRIIAVAALSVLAIAACSRQGSKPPVKTGASLADSAEQVMQNVHYVLTSGGIQRGELFADSAYIFDDNTRYILKSPRTTFNTEAGVKNGTMRADRGRYNLRQQVLEGFGNVVITSTEGRRLTSPYVKYNQALNEVSSDTNFTMVEPGRTLSGVGFKADPQLQHVQVLRAPRGQGSFTLPGQ
jgi:LPS export ABC transporter protein LptC